MKPDMNQPDWIAAHRHASAPAALIATGVASLWAAAGSFRIGSFSAEICRNAPSFVPIALIALSLILIPVGLCMVISDKVSKRSDKRIAHGAWITGCLAVAACFGYWLFGDKPHRNLISEWGYEYGEQVGEVTIDAGQLRKHAGQPLVVVARRANPASDTIDAVTLTQWSINDANVDVTVGMPDLAPTLRLGHEIEYSLWTLPRTADQRDFDSIRALEDAGGERLAHRYVEVSMSRPTIERITRLLHNEVSPDELGVVLDKMGRGVAVADAADFTGAGTNAALPSR